MATRSDEHARALAAAYDALPASLLESLPATTPERFKPVTPATTGLTRASATACSYLGAIKRLRRIRGEARRYVCARRGCRHRAFEWAYRGASDLELEGWRMSTGRDGTPVRKLSKWSPLVWDYEPLCFEHQRQRDREHPRHRERRRARPVREAASLVW
ncbi:hypothetical protein [Cellulosimicrobium cellulans]|uniref:hypothetical protein n=1 Tax=Cellulosimicrobium cellulans TaxID=1710 RepID=UPI002404FD96|nr:hypothetical protein [Cellulosimicrobium cellulans]MDF9874814.1 hypothetical protein [Cellulosimicrobium cellulans]